MKQLIVLPIILAVSLMAIGSTPQESTPEGKEEFASVYDIYEVREPVQEPIEQAHEEACEPVLEEVSYQEDTAPIYSIPAWDAGANFMRDGVIFMGGTRYSWYSSNVARHYRTDEWSADENGVYRDSEGYVVVASQDAKGTVVDSPFGDAKVYDYCETPGTIDIYTNY